MTAPRCVNPGEIRFITRRTTQRQFLLRPDREVNQILGYVLGLALQKTGCVLHAFAFLSNHYHLLMSDPEGRTPEFMHLFNCLVARALNHKWKRSENLWSSEKCSAPVVVGEDTFWDKLVYTLVNPVAAGLVRNPKDWPGLISLASAPGQSFTFKRPEGFFSDKEGGTLPSEVTFRLEKPAMYQDFPDRAYREQIQRLVETELTTIRTERREAGLRGVVGKRRILLQEHTDTPTPETRATRKREISPHVACKDPEHRCELLKSLSDWRQLYRQSWEAWRKGAYETLFPAGTYFLRRYFSVTCQSVPSG